MLRFEVAYILSTDLIITSASALNFRSSILPMLEVGLRSGFGANLSNLVSDQDGSHKNIYILVRAEICVRS